MPSWLRSKCSPLGVIMPSSRWCGVRDEPVPVVPGARQRCAATFASNFDGGRKPLNGAPGIFIQGSTGSGAAPAGSASAPAPIAAPAARTFLAVTKARCRRRVRSRSRRFHWSVSPPAHHRIGKHSTPRLDAEDMGEFRLVAPLNVGTPGGLRRIIANFLWVRPKPREGNQTSGILVAALAKVSAVQRGCGTISAGMDAAPSSLADKSSWHPRR